MKKNKKLLEKISVDRKIVEGLRDGKSLTHLKKISTKGKGYVIKIRDLALEFAFIRPRQDNPKIFEATEKPLPIFPESLFPNSDGRSQRPVETDHLLQQHKPWITERLEGGWYPQTVFDELPIAIPRSSFYRYLQRHQLTGKNHFKNVLEIIHAPGECLQVDWGLLTTVVDSKTKKKKKIWVFIGTMGHSRYRMVRVVEKGDYKTTIAALTSMFEELGGIPKKVTLDNAKVFVIEASKYEASINPSFERYANYYSFIVEALPPSTPELKGKVERIVDPIRRLFQTYNFEDYNLETAQDHINRKLVLHNERKHSTHLKKPVDVLINDEVSVLTPLPLTPYELETLAFPIIRTDGYVRFENKYYRVDQRLKKQAALVVGNNSTVSIYCRGKLLEVYERIVDPFTSKACKDHYKEPWEKTLQDNQHYIRTAAKIGADVERFVNIVLAKGAGYVDTRVLWGIFSLDKKYEREAINKACRTAIELSQISYQAVSKILALTAQAKKKEPTNKEENYKTQSGKFNRPITEYKNHLRLV